MIHYYVFNATHSVFLTVGLKGSERGADDYISPKGSPGADDISGRSKLNRQGIQKVYDRLH